VDDFPATSRVVAFKHSFELGPFRSTSKCASTDSHLRTTALPQDFLSQEHNRHESERGAQAGARLAARLDLERQVGDLLKLDYSEATIVVHDRLRRNVGGLPLGAFLIATRIAPSTRPDPGEEDTYCPWGWPQDSTAGADPSQFLMAARGPETSGIGQCTQLVRINSVAIGVASFGAACFSGLKRQCSR
jgi:hypothetical protein